MNHPRNLEFCEESLGEIRTFFKSTGLSIAKIRENFGNNCVEEFTQSQKEIILGLLKSNISDAQLNTINYDSLSFETIQKQLKFTPGDRVRDFHIFLGATLEPYISFLLSKYNTTRENILRALQTTKMGKISSIHEFESIIKGEPVIIPKTKNISPQKTMLFQNITFEEIQTYFSQNNDWLSIYATVNFYKGLQQSTFAMLFIRDCLEIKEYKKGYIALTTDILLKIRNNEITSFQQAREYYLSKIDSYSDIKVKKERKNKIKDFIIIPFEEFKNMLHHTHKHLGNMKPGTSFHEYISNYIEKLLKTKEYGCLLSISRAQIKNFIKLLIIDNDFKNYDSYDDFNQALKKKITDSLDI